MFSLVGSSILTALSYSSYLSARRDYDYVAKATELKNSDVQGDFSENKVKYLTGTLNTESPIDHNSDRYVTLSTVTCDVVDLLNLSASDAKIKRLKECRSADFKKSQTYLSSRENQGLLKSGVSIDITNILSEFHSKFAEDAGKKFISSENCDDVSGLNVEIGLFGVSVQGKRKIGQKLTFKGVKVDPSMYTVIGKWKGSFCRDNNMIIRKDMTIEDVRNEMFDRCQSKKFDVAFWILAGIAGACFEEYIQSQIPGRRRW